jgi:hypothetical protein
MNSACGEAVGRESGLAEIPVSPHRVRMKITWSNALRGRIAGPGMIAVLGCLPLAGHGWLLTGLGTNNPSRVFMMVGNGPAALWQSNATINTVSVSVPAAQLGTGVAQAMTSNSTQAQSPYDGFTVCTPPAQVYVGAAYQRQSTTNPGAATLQVNSPANLTSAAGDAIPMSQISWTVSSLGGDANPTIIPAGTFAGATQFLASVTQGTMIENCHTFAYANTAIRAAGTYSGQVTYTLSVP